MYSYVSYSFVDKFYIYEIDENWSNIFPMLNRFQAQFSTHLQLKISKKMFVKQTVNSEWDSSVKVRWDRQE